MEITDIRESSDSVTTCVKWEVDYNFLTSAISDNAVDSPPFPCGDTSWCLRVYPNVKSISIEQGWLSLALARLLSIEQEKKVDFKLGFQTRNGQVYREFKGQHIFKKQHREVSQFILVHSLAERRIVKANGCLTVFCEICVPKDIQNCKMVDVRTGQVLVSYHYKEVKWNIPDFEHLDKKADYSVESPKFFCGYCNWCLRMYPNGRTGHGRPGHIRLALIRQISTGDNVQTSFTFGIANGTGGVYKAFFGKYIFDEKNSESSAFQFGERSKVQTSIVNKKRVVTIFCKIHITLISSD